MEDEKSVLIEFFGNVPIIRILDFLVENRLSDYSKAEITRGTGLSKATLFKTWHRLEGAGIIKQTRAFGKTKLYRLNEANPFVKDLKQMEMDLIKHYAEMDAKMVKVVVRA